LTVTGFLHVVAWEKVDGTGFDLAILPSARQRLNFMALLLNVKWIEKSDQPEPHQRIKRIGGSSMALRWEHTQAQAIQAIERGEFEYFVQTDGRALKFKVGQTPPGQKYLTVQNEGGRSQILLELPGFPGHKFHPNPDRTKARRHSCFRLLSCVRHGGAFARQRQ
jgi:hypothetical protein